MIKAFHVILITITPKALFTFMLEKRILLNYIIFPFMTFITANGQVV